MSYLHYPRLSFGGRFLSDVSTRNNVDENFRLGAEQQNLWNVSGGASFEILDCDILQPDLFPRRSDGSPDPAGDFVVTGAIDRSSAKMVDLDPDYQMASEIWALKLRVSHRTSGTLAFEGEMALCSFRDLWTRQYGDRSNGQPAGGRFVSILSEVTWGPAADASPVVQTLRDATTNSKLSVGLHTFGYCYTQSDPRWRTGACILHIGPSLPDEPDTALVHRRIASYGDRAAWTGTAATGSLDFAVSEDGAQIFMDVGHALLLSGPDGRLADLRTLGGAFTQLSRLSVGITPTSVSTPGATIPEAEVLGFYDLPQSPDWYIRTGGIVTLDVPPALSSAVNTTRLALLAHRDDGTTQLAATETADGVFYRSDHFVRRLDPGDSASVKLVARKFGKPLAGLQLQVGFDLRVGASGPGLRLGPVPPTDAKGETHITMTASDPGAPRAANNLDGQVFALFYAETLDPGGQANRADTGLGALDVAAVHVRDAFPVPDQPEFNRDIKPFMTQYAQLYPIMSAHLFDISDYRSLVANRQAMLLAFSREIDDPNYMPVTRDMSAGRKATLVKWLSRETGDPVTPLLEGSAIAAASAPEVPSDANVKGDVKERAAEALSLESQVTNRQV